MIVSIDYFCLFFLEHPLFYVFFFSNDVAVIASIKAKNEIILYQEFVLFPLFLFCLTVSTNSFMNSITSSEHDGVEGKIINLIHFLPAVWWCANKKNFSFLVWNHTIDLVWQSSSFQTASTRWQLFNWNGEQIKFQVTWWVWLFCKIFKWLTVLFTHTKESTHTHVCTYRCLSIERLYIVDFSNRDSCKLWKIILKYTYQWLRKFMWFG